MSRRNLFAGAAVAAVLFGAGGAIAADMPVYYEPEPAWGGWYLRGYGGFSKQVVRKFEPREAGVPGNVTIEKKEFEFSGFAGVGGGYDLGNGLRLDVTAERRFTSSFDGRDTWVDNGDPGENNWTGEKKEWLFLANAYWDFYSSGKFRPYIGAGIGAVHLTLDNLTDLGPGLLPPAPQDPDAWGYSPKVSKWNLAGALHAGFGYEISPQWTFDMNYRFLYLGDITSDFLRRPGVAPGDIDAKFHDVMSHDVMFGLRYTFN